MAENSTLELVAGRQAYQDDRYSEAILRLTRSLALAVREGNSATEQIAGELLCDIYAGQSDDYLSRGNAAEAYKASLKCLENAVYLRSAKERCGLLMDHASRLGNLGKDYATDRKYLLQAVRIGRTISDKNYLLHGLKNLSFVERELGNLSLAMEAAVGCWELSKSEVDVKSLTGSYARNALLRQAECHLDFGQLPQSRAACEAGLIASQKASDTQTYLAFTQIAFSCAARLGDESGAERLYSEAVQKVQPDQYNADALCGLLASYGRYLLERHPEQSVEVFGRELQLQRQFGTIHEQATTSHNLALAKSYVGDVRGALEAEEVALGLYTRANNAKGMALSRMHVQLYRQQLTSRSPLASRMVAKDPGTSFRVTAANFSETIAGVSHEVTLGGGVSLELHNDAEIIGLLQQTQDTLTLAETLDTFAGAWLWIQQLTANSERAIALQTQSVREHGNFVSLLTLAMVEFAAKSSEGDDAFREAARIAASSRERLALEMVQGLGYESQNNTALAVTHLCRAVEALDEMRSGVSTNAEEKRRFTDLNLRLVDSVLEQLSKQKDVSRCFWAMDFFRSRSLIERRHESAIGGSSQTIDHILGIARMKRVAIVSCYQGTHTTYIAVAHPQGQQLICVRHSKYNVPELVNRYVRSLQPQPWSPSPDMELDWSAKELFEAIIEPWLPAVERELDGIVFVPHGALARLPLGALPHLYRPPLFLLDALPITYSPSLYLLDRDTPKGQTAQIRRMLAVGIRDYTYHHLPELPSTHMEIDAIKDALEAEEVEASTVVALTDRHGPVKLTQVVDELGRATHVHFAAHAEARSDQPYNAWIFLSEDKLSAEQILRLEHGPSMVTLSACKSMLGYVSPSEGMQGLAYAFMVIGAHTVLATAWSVVDEASTAYFTTFYKCLLNGMNAAEATQTAASEVRKVSIEGSQGQKILCSHPGFWAPYMLYSTSVPFFSQQGREI